MGSDNTPLGCSIVMLIIVAAYHFVVGPCLFAYCLWHIVGKDIPWYADLVCGLIGAEIWLPVAIVVWVLRLCGIETPLL